MNDKELNLDCTCKNRTTWFPLMIKYAMCGECEKEIQGDEAKKLLKEYFGE